MSSIGLDFDTNLMPFQHFNERFVFYILRGDCQLIKAHPLIEPTSPGGNAVSPQARARCVVVQERL